MEFPTLFQMAMDYLPVQATSVPCEHVFSSAKDTDTAKRNCINPVLMEALQLLKFSLKKERLNFMAGWLTEEADVIVDMSEKSTKPTDGLSTLFGRDPNGAVDRMLNNFDKYDS